MRLSIIVSGKDNDQLFAVPKLQLGTCDAIDSAVNKTLKLQGLQIMLIMSFDKTFINSGLLSEACALLKHNTNNVMLWLDIITSLELCLMKLLL